MLPTAGLVETESSDVLRNPNTIDLVEVHPSPTISVRHAGHQTQQTLQLPAKAKNYPC